MNAPPLHIGLIIFPGFQGLDAFGPLDILNTLSWTHSLTISVLADTLTPTSTKSPLHPSATGQLIQPTHTFSSPPAGIDVLLVPGGLGTRDLAATAPAVSFIRDVFPRLQYLITVCTGATLAARAGVLDGRRATTNKMAFREISAAYPAVQWVARARWVVDGKVWSSSGVSAGMDVVFGWVSRVYGLEVAERIAKGLEYEWVYRDGTEDPFAVVYGVGEGEGES
ncbi:hypothetical protein HFD88_001970 [Aspergillus terreus]|nr:hypothetical protein HFD88_001970 [Aspergillus terreus]